MVSGMAELDLLLVLLAMGFLKNVYMMTFLSLLCLVIIRCLNLSGTIAGSMPYILSSSPTQQQVSNTGIPPPESGGMSQVNFRQDMIPLAILANSPIVLDSVLAQSSCLSCLV